MSEISLLLIGVASGLFVGVAAVAFFFSVAAFVRVGRVLDLEQQLSRSLDRVSQTQEHLQDMAEATNEMAHAILGDDDDDWGDDDSDDGDVPPFSPIPSAGNSNWRWN